MPLRYNAISLHLEHGASSRANFSSASRFFTPAAQDQFNSIDLSDNEIQKLENFPLLPKLKMLLLSNNRVARIAPGNPFPLVGELS